MLLEIILFLTARELIKDADRIINEICGKL